MILPKLTESDKRFLKFEPKSYRLSSGRPSEYNCEGTPIVVRVTTSGVQSSKIGQVGFAEWLKLFALADAVRIGKRKPYKYFWRLRASQRRIRIGDYDVWQIFKNGDVKVGCQKITYWEIVRGAFAVREAQAE